MGDQFSSTLLDYREHWQAWTLVWVGRHLVQAGPAEKVPTHRHHCISRSVQAYVALNRGHMMMKLVIMLKTVMMKLAENDRLLKSPVKNNKFIS